MIKNIILKNEGFVLCKSNFYTSSDGLSQTSEYNFSTGINKLVGEIDSGVWAASYVLSMYKNSAKKMSFFYPPVAIVDGKETDIEVLSQKCCYLDHYYYPLFASKRKTVYKLIKSGLKRSGIGYTAEEICNLFLLDSERIHRPVYRVGNERFRAMAAIGYAHGREVFCFPWLSKYRFNYYKNNILWLLDILEKLEVIAIVPVGE